MGDEQELEFTEDDQGVVDETMEEIGKERGRVKDDAKKGDEKSAESEESVADDGDEISQELKDRATQYGLDPESYSSADDLEAQILNLDRSWMEYVRRQQPARQQQVPGQQQQQVQPQPPAGQQTAPPEVPFKLDVSEDELPPEIVGKFNAALKQVHDYYAPLQQQMQQMQEAYKQQQEAQLKAAQQREQQMFMEAVGSLGHKQLFGEGMQVNQQQAVNLQRLYMTAESLAHSYAARGWQVPDMKTLIARAEQLEFGDQLKAYQSQMQHARFAKQSKQRLGTGRRSSKSVNDWDGDIEEHPALKEAWERMAEERGE